MKRVHSHLKRTGYKGRCIITIICYIFLFLGWLSLSSIMIACSAYVLEANKPQPADIIVNYPLLSIEKTCKDDIDECKYKYRHCYCERIVYCHLNFGEIRSHIQEYKRYTRCYPEKCLTGDFCNFIIGYNYTLWRINSEYTIISPEAHQTGYILGMIITTMIVLIIIPVFSCLCCVLGRLVLLWYPKAK
jgi:hypothetical protein